MKKNLLIFFITLFISFSACNYFESDNPTGITQIELNISNLKPLPDSLVYVGWITTNADSSIKIFERNVDQSGIISVSTTNDFNGLQKAQQFKVTVEEIPDTGSITNPGSTVILSGRFTLGSASLKVGEGGSIPSSSGVYTITTPTDTLDNDLSGIWFTGDIIMINDGTSVGLNLPVLHQGWIYEGLIIINDDTLSTGTFSDPEAPDDFSGYSGATSGYPFPGEDFLVNPPSGLTFPLNLSNASVVVTLGYASNAYPISFSYVILQSIIPADVQANSTHTLTRTDAQIPTGLVSIEVDIVE